MPYLVGENNHQSKLTAHQVHAIRREYVLGKTTLAEVGQRHGVSGATVAQIINRKTWQWLVDDT